MTLTPALLARVVGVAAALALSAATFAPAAVHSASRPHHVVRHAGTDAAGVSKDAGDEQSAESCWKMTDSDHNYGYTVPCSTQGAQHH